MFGIDWTFLHPLINKFVMIFKTVLEVLINDAT